MNPTRQDKTHDDQDGMVALVILVILMVSMAVVIGVCIR